MRARVQVHVWHVHTSEQVNEHVCTPTSVPTMHFPQYLLKVAPPYSFVLGLSKVHESIIVSRITL